MKLVNVVNVVIVVMFVIFVLMRNRFLCCIPGLRLTCCMSGKDRTGMSATLEQVQILSREFDLAEHEYQRALDAMRRLVKCIERLRESPIYRVV